MRVLTIATVTHPGRLEWAGVALCTWLACCCHGFTAGVKQGPAIAGKVELADDILGQLLMSSLHAQTLCTDLDRDAMSAGDCSKGWVGMALPVAVWPLLTKQSCTVVQNRMMQLGSCCCSQKVLCIAGVWAQQQRWCGLAGLLLAAWPLKQRWLG
jgi:hypothetical protein